MGQNDRALVYVERGQELRVTPQIIARTLDTFATDIYPLVTSAFGPDADLDKNGKVILLFLDIQDSYTRDKPAYTAGYFDPRDLEHRLNSNLGEILYMDTNPGLANIDSLYSTLAHEFQHLVNYYKWNLHNRPTSGSPHIETWLNEGLSLAAEELYQNKLLKNRVNYYYVAPHIALGNNFLHWDTHGPADDDADPAADYASVYLFFHYLRAHSGNAQIYSDIFTSPHRDYEAITTQIMTSESDNLASLRGSSSQETWKNLLAHWFAATVVQAPEGLLGFERFASIGDSENMYFLREGIVTYTDPDHSLSAECPVWNRFPDATRRQTLFPGDRIIATDTTFASRQNAPLNPAGLAVFGLSISGLKQINHLPEPERKPPGPSAGAPRSRLFNRCLAPIPANGREPNTVIYSFVEPVLTENPHDAQIFIIFNPDTSPTEKVPTITGAFPPLASKIDHGFSTTTLSDEKKVEYYPSLPTMDGPIPTDLIFPSDFSSDFPSDFPSATE